MIARAPFRLGVLFCLTIGAAQAQTANVPPPMDLSCPSADFTAFFRAFSERADLQRKYTLLPLEYGAVDMVAVVTEFKTRSIAKFDQIPQFRAKSGAILPAAQEMKGGKYGLDVITYGSSRRRRNGDSEQVVSRADRATANLYVRGTEERLYYRFKKTAACWFLFGISDRTT